MLPVFLALFSAVLWGGADFLGGLASRRAAAASVVALAHATSLALVLLYAIASHTAHPTFHTAVFGLAAGLSGGIGLVLFFRVLGGDEMGPAASVAGVLTAAVPVLFSAFTAEWPKPLQIGGFAIAAAAIWLIAYSPGSPPKRSSLIFAAVSGVGFGTMLVLLRAADGGVVWPLIFSRLSSAGIATLVSLGEAIWPRSTSGTTRKPSGATVLMFSCVGSGLLDAGGNVLYTTAALVGRLDVAAVLSSLYPAFTILLAALFLRERARKTQAVGMVLALGAVLMISM